MEPIAVKAPDIEPKDELVSTLRALRSYVEWEKDSSRRPSFFSGRRSEEASEMPGRSHQQGSVMQPTLESVRKKLGDCQRCPLGKDRTHLVFGEGNPQAKLVFVGEAPGADEDRQGRPFVGRAGQLLTRIIEAMKLRREDVYICNILKCRPPGNRNPAPIEINTCEPFLIQQLQAIRPLVICALGTFAAKTLLKVDAPITVLRGRFHDYNGIKLMPTFHPAYLLRNPGAKKQVWEDIQIVMKELEIGA